MKKGLLLLGMGLISAISMNAQTSPYTGSVLGEGDFYLYNVSSGMWLQNNDRIHDEWTTHAELGTRGLDFGIRPEGDGWRIDPKFGHNNSLNSGQDALYMDTDNPVSVWSIEPDPTAECSNGYTIMSNGLLLSESGEYLATDNDLTATWQLVSREERIRVMLEEVAAGKEVDCSWLIPGADHANQDSRWDLWTRYADTSVYGGEFARGNDSHIHGNLAIEMWQASSADYHIVLTDLPNGTYEFSLQGFYRDGSWTSIGAERINGTEEIQAYYFGNGVCHDLMSLLDGAQTEPIDYLFDNYVEEVGLYTPDDHLLDGNGNRCRNALSEACNCFFYGYYQNEPIKVVVTDGTLKIGVRKDRCLTRDDWTVFDNFSLKMVSAEPDASVVRAALEAAIAKANANGIDATEAQAALASGDVAAMNAAAVKQADLNIVKNCFAIDVLNAMIEAANKFDNKTPYLTAALNETIAGIDAAESPTALAGLTDNLRNARKMNARESHPNVWTGNVPAAGDFYIYNVGQQRFLCGGDDWGAHAALGVPGIIVTLIDHENGGFKFDTHLNNGGDSEYLNYGGYMDTPYQDPWAFIEVGNGVYNIARQDNTELLLGYSDNTYNRVDTDKADGTNPNNQWILVTKANRDALLATASAENPVDATYLIGMPGFNQREVIAWDGVVDGNIFGRGGNRPDFIYDGYNLQQIFFYQELEVPNGNYVLAVQGYYRDGSDNNHMEKYMAGEPLNQDAVVFAGDVETPLRPVTDGLNACPGRGLLTNVGYICNHPDNIPDYFQTGLLWNYVITNVTDGGLMIGIDKPGQQNAEDHVVVDNFRLTYFGQDDPTGINGVEELNQNKDGKIYNLQGVQVSNAKQRGIYIQNGKKFVVK